MKILLMCAGGMTTGALAANMRQYLDPGDTITADGVNNFINVIDEFDVFILGPQVMYKMESLKKQAAGKNKLFLKLNPMHFGLLDGKGAVADLKRGIKENNFKV